MSSGQTPRNTTEGEPATMARVQGMIEERWPGAGYTVWISERGTIRNVAVRFRNGRGPSLTIEGSGETWLRAFAQVDYRRAQMRKEASRGRR